MHCVDCGLEVSIGTRCRTCNGASIRTDAAFEADVRDRELLAMVAADNLSAARLGARVGVSRVVAERRISNAKRRQAILLGNHQVDGRPCWCDGIPHSPECDRQLHRVMLGTLARL